MFGTAIAISAGVYAFAVEPNWIKRKKYVLLSPKWPKSLKPLRIAFAADFHVGCPSMDLEKLNVIVQEINKMDADIILLGGDYLITGVLLGKYTEPEVIGHVMSGLKARLGVFSVMGNHDWWEDGEGMWKALEEAGIKVLENDAASVTFEGRKIWIAGMADDTTKIPDYELAMRKVDTKDPVIMMAHDPVSFQIVDQRPVVTLCGHTHGGQITIPYVTPLVSPGRAPLRYSYGHVQEKDGRDMIVTCGLGTSGVPLRFGRRPEIVEIVIEGAMDDELATTIEEQETIV